MDSILKKMIEVLKKSDPERLARLEQMGFDTNRIWLHGTGADIKEFDAGKSVGSYGPGTYLSDYFRTPNDYAAIRGGGAGDNVMPVFVKKGDYLPASSSFQSALPKEIAENWKLKILKLLEDSPNKNEMFMAYSTTGLAEDGKKTIENMIKNTSPYNSIMEIWDYGFGRNTENFGKALQKQGIQGIEQKFSKPILPEDDYVTETYRVIPSSENIKSIWAKGKGPGLLGGFAAMPNMNPLEDLRKFVDKYREVQGPLADKITEQVSQPFGGADEGLKALGRMGFDPLNIGAAGDVVGAIELLTPEQKKEKLIKTMEKK